MDLFKDWNNYLADQFNLQDDAREGAHYQYFQKIERHIPKQKRTLVTTYDFECPPDFEEGYRFFKKTVEEGGDLKPFLSRRVDRLDKEDGMHAQWGIRHFHLGDKFENDGFVSRTGPLIYALIKPEKIYVICIALHGKWCDTEIIKVLHDNWPEVIKPFKVELEQVNARGDQEDIEENREYNLNELIKMDDGTMYHYANTTVSGQNEMVVQAALYMMRAFASIQKKIEDTLTKNSDYRDASPKLIVEDALYKACCETTGFCKDITDEVTSAISKAEQCIMLRED
ncbi:hypothetical protein [Vibrio neptunius]|uniref:hypothetical protein n=1 Tax=Vibrio neptunius TaxID=170651 RepID=UPI003CE478E6